MADKTPDQEPSIEEILASIRQIISDDDEKDADSPAAEPEAKEAAPDFSIKDEEPEEEAEIESVMVDVPEPAAVEEEDDVLELTEAMVPVKENIEVDLKDFDVPSEPAPQPEAVQIQQPEPAAPAPAPKPAPAPEVSMNTQATAGEDILTEAAKSAALSSMAKLAGNMPITRHREYGNITLEDLVREMLHPMLRDWVSENLPSMVERLVQKELEKLARQAQDV